MTKQRISYIPLDQMDDAMRAEMDSCRECGFEYDLSQAPSAGPAIIDGAAAFGVLLCSGPTDLRARREPPTWSPLEYGCHVRDVFRIYDQRLARMLLEDDPLFANWDQDATAVDDDYASQDPAVVAGELAVAGEAVAGGFGAVEGAQWTRSGRRSDGATFTIESFARYFVHDPIHHLYDVESAGL